MRNVYVLAAAAGAVLRQATAASSSGIRARIGRVRGYRRAVRNPADPRRRSRAARACRPPRAGMRDSRDTRTRTVTLPSGKTVVVTYVDEHLTTTAPDPECHLEVCGACTSQLVHPVEWQEAGTQHWQIMLRCPECEWQGTGVFDNAAVQRYDEVLERAAD